MSLESSAEGERGGEWIGDCKGEVSDFKDREGIWNKDFSLSILGLGFLVRVSGTARGRSGSRNVLASASTVVDWKRIQRHVLKRTRREYLWYLDFFLGTL